MQIITIILLSLTGFTALASDTRNTNLIAVGQGISSPTSTSTINYSSGYTSESPLGTIYQNGFRLTAEYDKTDSTEAYGGEIGYGQGEWGIAAGQHKTDCSGCKATSAAALGLNISDIGVGIRFAEDIYGVGFLFNPRGTHRLGIMVEANSTAGNGKDVTSYGVGYSYVETNYTLTLDASKRSFEDKSVDDDRMQLTPGIMLRADMFQISVNDKITLNKDKSNSAQNDKDSVLWLGLGIGGDKFHLAIYSDYVAELALAGSVFF